MAEFNMDITNTSQYDNPAVLLASTNKLLDIVGIGAKQIQSIEELTRVASSMFVAIFETVFYARIEGAVRNPFSRSDYIKNAQLVIDNISRHIDIDLSHISGEDIVNGTVFALSFLVHIILGVVRITR